MKNIGQPYHGKTMADINKFFEERCENDNNTGSKTVFSNNKYNKK